MAQVVKHECEDLIPFEFVDCGSTPNVLERFFLEDRSDVGNEGLLLRLKNENEFYPKQEEKKLSGFVDHVNKPQYSGLCQRHLLARLGYFYESGKGFYTDHLNHEFSCPSSNPNVCKSPANRPYVHSSDDCGMKIHNSGVPLPPVSFSNASYTEYSSSPNGSDYPPYTCTPHIDHIPAAHSPASLPTTSPYFSKPLNKDSHFPSTLSEFKDCEELSHSVPPSPKHAPVSTAHLPPSHMSMSYTNHAPLPTTHPSYLSAPYNKGSSFPSCSPASFGYPQQCEIAQGLPAADSRSLSQLNLCDKYLFKRSLSRSEDLWNHQINQQGKNPSKCNFCNKYYCAKCYLARSVGVQFD